MLVGYACVSTQDQNLDLQRDALTRAGCERLFEEKKSGKAGTRRPEFDAALAYLRPDDTRAHTWPEGEPMTNVVTFSARPSRAAGATLTPVGIALAPDVREHIERVIEAALETAQRLITILDRANSNPDLEDGADDEPSLGAPEGHASQVVWLRGGDRDLETTTPEDHP